MQSRYYDPAIGRFINADAFTSTGQGILGNNMFTYCLNNPVAHADASGSAAKACLSADGTIADAPWRDHSPGGGGIIYHCDNITTKYDGDKFYTQIALRHIGNFTKKCWDAYVHSNELQVQQQYQQDMVVIKSAQFAKENPYLALDLVALSISAVGAYCFVITCFGATIPAAVSTVVNTGGVFSTAWSIYRAIGGDAWNQWLAYIEES